ncbi:KAR9-domain-containing protein [Melanomma pulvis-pyrius CBS 109.77]|uniref:KAR9-domain-containing protein n=1 Tax=Melanomma pulvis-pyrius CBS 109.77 TaxID=1314802 RepID=A0A6A6XCM9_9PLEO|nr:KAR9-domain-containing protein [Melanomma pulvis-pyrius CBS 109.77]
MSSPLATPSVNPPLPPPPATPAVSDVAAATPFSSSSSIRTASISPHRTSDRSLESDRKLARNVSPGLLARMKFLNQSQDTNRAHLSQIGRIAESKIRQLDAFHKDRSIRIERRGTTWGGTGSQAGTPLIPQLTGESVPPLALAMDQSPPPGFESDRSSFVSTSDRVLPSDSEAGDALPEDTQKYRLPDITKTKSLSQTLADTDTRDSTTDADATRAPTPPPKDTPPADEVSVLDDHDGIDVDAYFKRRLGHFARANSIYTLSRASFTNQIQQLTSITLPPASSLSSSISAIPTSTAAGRALHEAANQIRLWMAKANEVLSGLDAEDDVEWAAAAGREGLAEVDGAIGKFEDLVTVYITAIEELQSRPDIASLPTKDQTRLVTQMEDVVNGWTKIKKTLKGIKTQVEIAMEWEELWNIVLGEIGHEIENLSRHVFEMEERRHRAITDSVAESAEKFDIAELETIVEETPRQQARIQNNRFSLPAPPLSIMSPISPIPQIEKENSRLLALFAKLQPLRASLDFLPMRLSSFQMRANKVFPSACDELLRRKEVLEKQEKKLEADADALREELGEDKWVHSFRQAGSKAIAMYDSLMKSIQRLRQAIDENDEDKLGTRISTYKDKREHYPPSMKRVLELIDIEMRNRSTVNGEILRIQQDVRQKVADLELQIKDMDAILDEFTSNRKLRDSVSTIMSSRTEASMTNSAFGTPNSSPASSIILVNGSGKKSRQPSASSSRPANRRYSSVPVSTNSNNAQRKSLTASRLEAIPSSTNPSRAMTSTPTRSVRSSTPGSDQSASKPRWNASVHMRDTVIGHNFKPLSLTTPSPHRKLPPTPVRSLRSVSSHSAIPVRSPLSIPALESPLQTRPASTTPAQQPHRRPLASPMQSPSTPARAKAHMRSTPGSTSQVSVGTPASGRRFMIPEEEEENTGNEESPIARRQSRPASAMASRRASLLPTPKQRTVSGSSFAALTGATTPGRSSSRLGLGAINEGRNSRIGGVTSGDGGRTTSRISGRKSSLDQTPGEADRPRWK